MIRVGQKFQHLIRNVDCKCCDPAVNDLTEKMNTDLSRRGFFLGAGATLAGLGLGAAPTSANAQAAMPRGVLFENVRIFDGMTNGLSAPSSVLVVGNAIRTISTGVITPPANVALTRIAGGGRTLTPGLIDAHMHIMFATVPMLALATSDIGFINVAAVKAANDTLMRGFTSIRDLGGPTFGLKEGIDRGLAVGPRIWPSGAYISQSGGHGEFRLPHEFPARLGEISYWEREGATAIADDPGMVRKRARELLARGASQLKLHVGGGVASIYDPLDVTQFTVPEIRAAVEAAQNWGTYVTVHAYTPNAGKLAIEGGVTCIEHGHLFDDATVQLMAEKGIWWCMQPFLDDEDAQSYPEGSSNRKKQLQMFAGTDNAYALAKKHKIRTAWGSDTIFDARLTLRQGAQLSKLTRWYSPFEVLKMATADNAQLLALSGLRSPYEGKLGVIQEGALADLLLMDGDPLANIKLIEDPAKNFRVIMKDGAIFKNTVT
jgi:imidazolonepropionase-like amidohydrolase